MSNRTIIEINHDMGINIANNPTEFVDAIMIMIRFGTSNDRNNAKLATFGVTVTPTAHHTEDVQ